MTIVSGDPLLAPSGYARTPRPADVGFLDAISGPAWRMDNTVANMVRGDLATPEEIQASQVVDVWGAIKDTKYERNWDSFAPLRSAVEVERMKERIDREESDRQLLADAGMSGFAASAVASIFDLPSLIPGGAAIATSRGAGMALRVGARTAIAAGAEAAGTEAYLQGAQETRTLAESAGAIGGSIILGGLLGTSLTAIIARSPGGQEAFNKAVKMIDTGAGAEPMDAGAAARIRPQIEDFDLPTGAAQGVLNATPAGISYTTRFLKSRSPVMRKIGSELLQNPLALAGTERLQMQPAVDIFATIAEDKHKISIMRAFRDDYKAYRKAPGGAPVLSHWEWAQRISAAMRRGDVDVDYPAVADAAAKMRREVVEPLKEQAIEMGLLPKDVKPETAVSYFTRMWDAERIKARRPEFLSRMERHFSGGIKADRSVAADLTEDEIRAYAREAAEDVFKTLTRVDTSPTSLLNVTIGVERGPLAKRTLNVRDVDFEDFLNNDAEHVLNRYARVMSAETELTRRFGRADMKDQIAEIDADFQRILNEGYKPPKGSGKKARPWTEKENREIANEWQRGRRSMEAARDIVRGTYMAAERASGLHRTVQGALTFNYIRALGDVLRSSLTDVVRPAMVHGMGSFIREGVAPLIRSAGRAKAARREIADAAGIAEVLLNSRMMRLADVTDPVGHQTPVENVLGWMGSKASLFSGILHWNQFLKETSSYMFTRRLQRLNLAKPATRDARMLQRLKLTRSAVERIQDQMATHGTEAGGIFIPNLDAWDANARRLYEAAVRADADTVVVTPSVGERIPFAEENWLTKPALQFKQFALSSHQKTLMVGLQEDQARFASNAALMVSMGMFVYWLKAQSLAKDRLSDNPGTWLAEGIDRSGLVPIYMEVNNMWERLGGPGVYQGLGSALGEAPQSASRYQVRSVPGSLLGPTFGLLTDTSVLLNSALTGEATKGTVSSARRMVPFGNVPGIKEYLNLWVAPSLYSAVE